MSDTADPYVVLDIDRGADAEQIRQAFRRLIARAHPDRSRDANAADAAAAIISAYRTLSDPERRRMVDRTHHSRPVPPGAERRQTPRSRWSAVSWHPTFGRIIATGAMTRRSQPSRCRSRAGRSGRSTDRCLPAVGARRVENAVGAEGHGLVRIAVEQCAGGHEQIVIAEAGDHVTAQVQASALSCSRTRAPAAMLKLSLVTSPSMTFAAPKGAHSFQVNAASFTGRSAAGPGRRCGGLVRIDVEHAVRAPNWMSPSPLPSKIARVLIIEFVRTPAEEACRRRTLPFSDHGKAFAPWRQSKKGAVRGRRPERPDGLRWWMSVSVLRKIHNRSSMLPWIVARQTWFYNYVRCGTAQAWQKCLKSGPTRLKSNYSPASHEAGRGRPSTVPGMRTAIDAMRSTCRPAAIQSPIAARMAPLAWGRSDLRARRTPGHDQQYPVAPQDRAGQFLIQPCMGRCQRMAVQVDRRIGADHSPRQLPVPAGIRASRPASARTGPALATGTGSAREGFGLGAPWFSSATSGADRPRAVQRLYRRDDPRPQRRLARIKASAGHSRSVRRSRSAAAAKPYRARSCRRDRPRLVARPPEGIEAVGTLDRAAGILRHPQARRIGRPIAPSGPGPVSSRKNTKLLFSRITARPCSGLRAQPCHQPLHRRLIRPDQPAVAHQLADAGIVAAILPGIADAHHATIGQSQPPRSLHLQEEHLDRIGRPCDFEATPGQRAVLDRGPIIIGNELRTLDPAAHPLALQIGRKQPEIGLDQIAGTP
ncbi:hypothetical protein SASPL_157689 [Salvia splendens]|uniref:J domain-containing protein n=1 Tax=Salvia splendens TaxID=180675 RepID=A0A8X8YW13_SALSN|nr:hypothetical protein SASPL_157689 [Salvia splendens]